MKRLFCVVFSIFIIAALSACSKDVTNEMDSLKKDMQTLKSENEELKAELQQIENSDKHDNEAKVDNVSDDDAKNENTVDYQKDFPLFMSWIEEKEMLAERAAYEEVINGIFNLDDEIARGWLDEGSIALLTLIKGESATSSANAGKLISLYNGLDVEIGSSNYCIRDFFCVDNSGEPTNTGIYNFFEAVDALENDKFDGKNVVFINSSGDITGWDFSVAGGEKEVAKALGISEEMVFIILHAAIDVGFSVTF